MQNPPHTSLLEFLPTRLHTVSHGSRNFMEGDFYPFYPFTVEEAHRTNRFLFREEFCRFMIVSLVLDGHARVTVQDEGMGISPEGIPHIFDRFYRTDQSRDRKTGGTGLGLSIAKWIIDRHGGWFEVVSREGVGTRISFLLPADQTPPEEEAAG